MTIGKTTFDLSKKDYSEQLGRIINNHRANARLIGSPREFVLRSCRLSDQWKKMANDPEVLVYLRNIDIAGGRKVKMICLEVGNKRQPVPKAKLIDSLYPVKQTRVSATAEEKHHNQVKSAMRRCVANQLRDFRSGVPYPLNCYLTGKRLIKGSKTDVDHVEVSFAELADTFLIVNGLRYSDIVLVGPPTGKRFKDTELWDRWSEYHLARAKFALVCSSANRSKGCGEYVTPEHLYGSFSANNPEELSLDF